MNLIFGILWLSLAVGLFGYEFTSGSKPYTVLNSNLSAGWLFLLLAGWNFVRWYSARARTQEQVLWRDQQARFRQGRTRERPSEPDPTFDFSPKPPSSSE